MEEFIDPAVIEHHARDVGEWFVAHVLTWSTALQLALLVAVAIAARILSSRLRPFAMRLVAGLRIGPMLKAFAALLVRHAGAVVFLLLLWLVIGVMVRVAPLGESYLLRLVASLMSAWIVISLSSSLIRNPVMARTVAVVVWTIAALNITGLLAPTFETLDALAITLGNFRVSLLTVLKGMAALTVLLWGAITVSGLLETRIKRITDLTPSVQVLLGKLLKITLLTLAVVIALNSVGIDLTALAVLSGAIGLGVGFGLQKVVSNLISGLILLLDKSIKPGDVIELEETFGWITSLGARYVSVVTRDGKEYLIPNEDLITHRVVNWSFTDQLVRLEVCFGVSYDSDPHAVRRIACEAAARPERVVDNPVPVCHLSGFGDSSLDFLLRFWIRDPQKGVANITGEVLLAVWDAFKAEGVQIPYPHRQVILQPSPATSELAAAE